MKILWLKTELLHPPDKGGRIRTYQMLRELRKQHHVTYLTLDDGAADPKAVEKAGEYAHEVITVPHQATKKFSPRFYLELLSNLFSSLPYFISKYRSPAMNDKIRTTVAEGDFDVVVCDFLVSSINLPSDLPCPTVLFQHNVEAMIWKRHFETARNPIKRAYLKAQWKRTERYERFACSLFDRVVTVSENDTAIIRGEYAVDNVSDVPTGVDLAYFTPGNGSKPREASIVFTGSMDWLPNHDAIEWFIKEVLPIVRRSVPHASLTVVGRDPFPALFDLAKGDPRITITGSVPDVRPYMREAEVYAVPIRIGGGTRLKIYEAMAMELPIVSTSVGAEGLPLRQGTDILLQDSAADFATALVKLIEDKEFARSLGSAAGNRVRGAFGWDKAATRFIENCVPTRSQVGSDPDGPLSR